MIKDNPDVDLSHTDRNSRVISRRHARIIDSGGRIEIEDLGSTNGTTVNGRRLAIDERMRLKPGDRIALGLHEFLYQPMSVPKTSPHAPPHAYLWSTFTGHRFPLPTQGDVTVGRKDPTTGTEPDIDLSQEGDAAQVVARRHARIVAHGGRHYVEDLGSARGVKLNGARVRIGEIGLLEPGDHIWLGGLVLAYDITH
jgi:pSer/pThr/pTyr-binding forkhead associated (FHA) protein